MNTTNWNLAPKGADSIKVNPANVLRWFKGNSKYMHGIGFTDGFNNNSEWVTVATRPTEQKKTVEDSSQQSSSEEKQWTHKDAFGDPCQLLVENPDITGFVIILRQSGHYTKVAADSVKPLKPKLLSKKEYGLLAKYASHLYVTPSEFDQYISENYEVAE